MAILKDNKGKSRTRPEQQEIPDVLGLLPLRDIVIFPGVVIPLSVGRNKGMRLIEEVVAKNRFLGVFTQKNPADEDPKPEEIYSTGTTVQIMRFLKMPDGSQSILLNGLSRTRIVKFLQSEPYYKVKIEILKDIVEKDKETDALILNLKNLALKVMELSQNVPTEATIIIQNIPDPARLVDFIASNLDIPVVEKQDLLETLELKSRCGKISRILTRQLEVLELSTRIQSQMKSEVDKRQREFFLREQLNAIRKELGEGDEKTAEINELKKRIEEANMPPDVLKEANRELERLSSMPAAAAEYTVSRTYLQWLVELPWSKSTGDNLDIERAERVLNEDHHDLEKVKKRILEFLSVRKLKKDTKGPILCFVGPPGVGKTSLGKSIARALERKFVRMSLGGIRDEAEIRGHRRTYIGSLPGSIIQGIRRAGFNNPVFMLDEVDKVGMDFRGDPSSALLEVLDPEQNSSFTDHYLDVAFDLSKVMFITTANILDPVPPALKDRMEVLELPGYTEEEKMEIARKYLVPRQIAENGLSDSKVSIDGGAIAAMIRNYTKEAGVRNLEREISAICRGVATNVARGKDEMVRIGVNDLAGYLGAPKFFSEIAERIVMPGVAIGLAWTPTGGDIIFVEATKMRGDGKLVLTGQLGDVMKESAQAALSYVRSRAAELGVQEDIFKNYDIHIHVPAGAIPKDGPSAGVTMFTALVSLLTNHPLKDEVAMTGEITLRGMVLPVGGVKEKVLAAKRAGIKTVILPEKNKNDLQDVPADVKEALAFVFVSTMEEIIGPALGEKKTE
jgi:ATP-dependent Lon protease